MAANLMDVINHLNIEELRKIRTGAVDPNILSNFKDHCEQLEVGDITDVPSEERFLLEKLDLLLEIYQQDSAVVEILSGVKHEILTPFLYDIVVQTSVDTSERSETSSERGTVDGGLEKPFLAFKKDVCRRITAKNNPDACDFILISLDHDNALSLDEQARAESAKRPILINRPLGWSIYGYVQGVWAERKLENLTPQEQRALDRFNFQKTEMSKIDFPAELKSRLKQCHTYSNPMKKEELASLIDRMLTPDQDRRQSQDTRSDEEILDAQYKLLIDDRILNTLASLNSKVVAITLDDSIPLVSKIEQISGLYQSCQEQLRNEIKGVLYPRNAPSIEDMEIEMEGELSKTLGDYIRAKSKEFGNNEIKSRLAASYLKMCMQYINAKIPYRMNAAARIHSEADVHLNITYLAELLPKIAGQYESGDNPLTWIQDRVKRQLTMKEEALQEFKKEQELFSKENRKLANKIITRKEIEDKIKVCQNAKDKKELTKKRDNLNVDIKKTLDSSIKAEKAKIKTFEENLDLIQQNDAEIGQLKKVTSWLNPEKQEQTSGSTKPKKATSSFLGGFFRSASAVASTVSTPATASTASAPAPVAASIAPAVASTASAPAPVAASARSTPVRSMASGPVMWEARRSQVSQSPSPVAAQHRSPSAASPIPPVVPANAESQQSAPENATIESPRGNVAKK